MNELEIFSNALEIASVDERSQYLDQACGNDATQRKRIETLLEEQANVGSFMEHPPVEGALTELCSDTAKLAESPSQSSRATVELDDVSLDFLEPSDQPDSLGRLAQYEITEVVGRGGMGIVLKAHDTKLNRVVAVKVLAPVLAANATARKRFLREARSTAAVSHDHVVTIYAVEEGDLPFLVMEFIDGQTLQQKIDCQGHLELKEILRIGRQIANGLAAAHEQGLIHRDVKPSNILLLNGIERVQITDFGLARAVDDTNITRTGEITGTPEYMSPEQAQGNSVDARSDLFSLGSVLYAMCTGRSPFRAETTMASLRRVCDDTPRPIREVNPEIPQWLMEIIDHLLEKNPEDRLQTATEVSDVLSRHLAHVQDPLSTPLPGSIETTSSRKRQASGRHRRLFAACALLVLISGLGLTEATGVTEMVTTVIRIVTGEGTLVVEVDDPDVTIQIDGEELIIMGAGVREVRVRPGQYRIQALKNGKPVRQELVTITRGGRQVVKIGLLPLTLPAQSSPATESTVPVIQITRAKRLFVGQAAGWNQNIRISPDGKRALTGGQRVKLCLWDIEKGRELRRFEGHTATVDSVDISPDGRCGLSGSRDATLRLWDLETGKQVRQFKGHTGFVHRVAFSPDGRLILSFGLDHPTRRDYTLRLWDVQTGHELRRLEGFSGRVEDIAFSPDGKRVAGL